MKVKVLTTLKSGSDIIPAGQILTDDEIPAFIVKLAEAESQHVAILPDDPKPEPESEDKGEEGEEEKIARKRK